MDVLEGIIGEAECLYMSDETMLVFGRLLDDVLAERIQNYLNSSDGYGGVKDRIRSLIGDKVLSATFHKEVLDRGVMSLVAKLNLESLAYAEMDLSAAITDLVWLQDHKHLLKSYIEPRRKEDYAAFLSGLRDMTIPADVPHYHDVIDRVQANSSVFYKRNEKVRATRIGILVSMSDTWEMALQGLRYLDYCNKKSIMGYLRKEF